jgi:hypothetical protein
MNPEEQKFHIKKTDLNNSQECFTTTTSYTAKEAEALLRSWRAYNEKMKLKVSYEFIPVANVVSQPPVVKDETLVFGLFDCKTGEYRGFVRTRSNIPACYAWEEVPVWQCLEFKQSA